jgi:cellulose synthase/poly-beta-1,6-N-acetylglucosamine synthase-like glycosyltransferase
MEIPVSPWELRGRVWTEPMSANLEERVSVIIPARNEEANIARVLRSLAGQKGIREILVVDDQSEDRTPAILAELSSEIPRLRTLRVYVHPALYYTPRLPV